jgi:DNA-binding MarR family transcriptional regulator
VTIEPDPSDGRAKLVELTERGWQAMDVGLAANADREAAVAERLGERRLAQLRRTLQELSASQLSASP